MNNFSFGQNVGCQFLCNIDFEQDKLVGLGQFGFFHESKVACWNTTASDKQIEIWGSGFGGVTAYSGNQFAELNANMVSTLFQRFVAGVGGSVEVSFAHRGRAGVDVMSVEVGPEGGPYQSLGSFSAGNKQWEFHVVNFTFPVTGRTDYVIRFNSISAAGGATVGNFLDAISIKLKPPQASFITIQPECESDSSGRIILDSVIGTSPFTYLWDDPSKTMTSSLMNLNKGKYRVEIKDFYGCVNTYDFELKANHQPDTILEVQRSCGAFYWMTNHQDYSNSGIYYQNYVNRFGCDSLCILDLTIVPTYKDTIHINECNDFYWDLDGKIYNQSGMYLTQLKNQFGCDSTIVLDLKINKNDSSNITVSSCTAYYWALANKTFDTTGIYKINLINSHGCDSVVYLNLLINPHFKSIQSEQSCDSYYWPAFDTLIKSSGKYLAYLKSANNCDSVIELNLSIYESSIYQQVIEACDEYYWPVSKKNYNATGIYSYQYQSTHGCDSIVQLNLKVNRHEETSKELSGCDSVLLDHQTYFADHRKDFVFSDSKNCDSILHYKINIYPSYHYLISEERCHSFYWNVLDKELDVTGTYWFHTKSLHGCDSSFALELKINPSYEIYDSVLTHKNYFWPVNGVQYKSSGFYEKDYFSVNGCDSIHYLFLRIEDAGQVWVPNVFSPNGDQVNDVFMVFSSPNINEIEWLKLFDRWGNEVFYRKNFPPNNPLYGWNGNFKQENCQPGVYAYVVQWVDLAGVSHLDKGDVTLVK